MSSQKQNWKPTRIKFLADLKSGVGITSTEITKDGEFPVYGGNGLRGFASAFTHDGEYALIGRQGALCGNVHRVSGQFWASEHAVVATTHSDTDPNWFAYLAGSMKLGQYSVSAAQPGLAVDRIRELPVRAPPTPVQTAIANYLDEKTVAIDALIEKKRKLLDLLAEERAALINQAVTKGLDPTVPMKNSRIEWIGAIPRDWRVCRIGYLASVGTGGTPSQSDADNYGGGIPWVRTTEVKDRFVTETEQTLSEKGLAASNCRLYPTGTVLVAMYGQGLTRGRAAILSITAATNQACAAILPTEDIVPDLLWAVLTVGYWALRREAQGGQQPNLSLQMVKDFRIPVPPRQAQDHIVESVNNICRRASQAEAQIGAQVDRLYEYRQALITAAVTGQLNIEAAA